jgi:hypothetical protein
MSSVRYLVICWLSLAPMGIAVAGAWALVRAGTDARGSRPVPVPVRVAGRHRVPVNDVRWRIGADPARWRTGADPARCGQRGPCCASGCRADARRTAYRSGGRQYL